VRHTLLYNYMVTPDAVEEALHLWNAVEPPDRFRDSGVDVEPPNVVVSSAPVPTLT
jgi:hypothetical protein